MDTIIKFLQSLGKSFSENALANAIGTVAGGVLLSGLVFPIVARLFRLPDLNGLWIIDLGYRHSKYRPYRGMLVRYKALLLHDGNTVTGTAEKIYENSNGNERSYFGTDRVRVKIEGAARKGYFQRSRLLLHFTEDGDIRQSSTVVRLTCHNFARGMTLRGIFSTTAADSSGTTNCTRLPLDNAILEYRGFPIRWFGRFIEFASYPFYRREWQQLQQQVNASRNSFLESYASYSCRPLVVALVLAEDIRYYDHGGVDPIAMVRAIWQTIVMGNPQGGSTIEQQLVRVLTKDYRRSIRRKLKEIVLASRLHSELDKDLIPVAYLTVAYCGWRMNGIRQAAKRLKIDLKSPTYADAAALVARIRYPEPKTPIEIVKRNIETRCSFILHKMRLRPHLFA